MTEINANSNTLNSYYTTASKVKKPERTVVTAPVTLPSNHIYSNKECDEKLKIINTEIHNEAVKEKKKTEGNVLKYIAGVAAAFLGFIGIKYLIKFFRKS